MTLRQKLKKHFDTDFPISGGTGKSEDDPIILHRAEPNDYIGLEYEILECLGIIREIEWQKTRQAHLVHNGRHLDRIDITFVKEHSTRKTTKTESYYFDFTECADPMWTLGDDLPEDGGLDFLLDADKPS